MLYNACECPKCLLKMAQDAATRKSAGIDAMAVEKAIEKALRERERRFWPCGEPRTQSSVQSTGETT